MRHEVIALPETGVELETYLTDNRAVEAERRKPLMLVFPGGHTRTAATGRRSRWPCG